MLSSLFRILIVVLLAFVIFKVLKKMHFFSRMKYVIRGILESSVKKAEEDNEKNPFWVITKWSVLAIVVLVFLFGSWYMVAPGSKAVVFRFGQVINTTDPGIHFKLPIFDRTVKVVTDKIMRYEFGYRTVKVGPPAQYKVVPEEELMVTADGKILEVDWVLQYLISNPENYILKIPKNSDERTKTIRDIAEAEFRGIINMTNMDDILTTGKERINTEAREKIQKKLDKISSGVNIVSIQLQDVTPPKVVVASFNEVNSAKAKKDQKILEANKYANEKNAEAVGAAMKEINEAEAYSARRISVVEGETKRIMSLLPKYKENPELVRGSLRVDAYDGLWKKLHVYIIDTDNTVNVLPLGSLPKPGTVTE